MQARGRGGEGGGLIYPGSAGAAWDPGPIIPALPPPRPCLLVAPARPPPRPPSHPFLRQFLAGFCYRCLALRLDGSDELSCLWGGNRRHLFAVLLNY